MNTPTVLHYYIGLHPIINGSASAVVFEDDTLMLLMPETKYGRVEGLDSVLLYQHKTLEAWVTTTSPGFWSRGKRCPWVGSWTNPNG